MSFNAGDLVATLRVAGLPQFMQDTDRAGSAWKRLGEVGKTALGVAGAAIGIVGSATAVTTGLLFAQGVEYNRLQQTSRAALKTMLGGAEQVNAQMAKLDAFARESPFSKSVFLQAQQQLLAFGLEAEKVVPYLDSIQNAVAAMGGSNQDIAELARIMAQIKSSARITGEDLLQFGARGVDAAALIGEQMGLTGAEIREQITAGTLDAGAALDALAAGMQAKFGGAAANVKQTFDGMWDRIKAASRDIGALLAAPFVDPEGGGAFVRWGNQFADVLRGVQSKVGPIMDILVGRSAGAFAAVTTNLTRLNTVVRSFDPGKVTAFLNEVARYGPAAGAAIGLLGSYALGAIPGLGMLKAGVVPLLTAIVGFVAASPELRAAVADVLAAGKPLVPVLGELAEIMAGVLTASAPVLAAVLGGVAEALSTVLGIVAQIPTPILVAAGAFILLSKAGPPLLKFGEWMMGLGSKAIEFGQNLMSANTSSGTFKGGLGSLLGAFNPVTLAITAATAALAIWIGVQVAAAQAAATQRRAVEQVRDAYLESEQILTETQKREQARTILQQREAGKFAEAIGVGMEVVERAALGSESAYRKVKAAAAEYHREQVEGGVPIDRLFEGTAEAGNDLVSVIRDARDAMAQGAIEAQKMRAAMREDWAAMGPDAQQLEGVNSALAIMRDTASDIPTKVNAIKEALRLLRDGGVPDAEDLTQQMNDTARSISDIVEGLEEAVVAGETAWEAIIGPDGVINTETSAGSQLKTQVDLLNDAMLGSIAAADEAAKAQGRNRASLAEVEAAAKPYRDRLREIAEAAGIPAPLIDALVGHMLAIPEVVGFMLDDSGTIDAFDVKLYDLAVRLTTLPEGTVTIDENATETIQALKDMGFAVSEPYEGKVTVTANGIEDVKTALLNLSAENPAVDILGIFHKPDTTMDPIKADVVIDATNVTIQTSDAVAAGAKGPHKAEVEVSPIFKKPDATYSPPGFGGGQSAGRGDLGAALAAYGIPSKIDIPANVTLNDSGLSALRALASQPIYVQVTAFITNPGVIEGLLRALTAPRYIPVSVLPGNLEAITKWLAVLTAPRFVPFLATLPNIAWAMGVLAATAAIRIAPFLIMLPNLPWAIGTLTTASMPRIVPFNVVLPNATWAGDVLNWHARPRTAVITAVIAAGDAAEATLNNLARPRTVRFVGDSDPSIVGFASGSALSRVQEIMKRIPGLTITDTFSTPERDAYYGLSRSPGSYHYDRANPAVDVAGSFSALSQFVSVLRQVGGWRQILWQVPGHYDHVHVAHEGGTVNAGWPRMPGDKADERTARLQLGEVVLPERVARYLRSLAVPVGQGRPSSVPLSESADRAGSTVSVAIVNPIARNVVLEAQEAADLIGAAARA